MSTMKKMITVSKEQLMSEVYNAYRIKGTTPLREYLRLKIMVLSHTAFDGKERKIGITFNSRASSAYTMITGKSKTSMRVVIGGGLVASILNLPNKFDAKEKMKPYIKEIVMAVLGLFYHEIGHDKYTDMADRSIVDYKEPAYIGFLHNLFNILEDAVIEVAISRECKEKYAYDVLPQDLFQFIIMKFFLPQAEAYRDDGSIGSFMNYLLLMLRCGRKNIHNDNAVFNKYEKDLMPMIKGFLTEPNGTKRVHKALELGEWIIENIKEFDFSKIKEPPEKDKKSGSRPSSGGPGGGMSPESAPVSGSDGDMVTEKGTSSAAASKAASEKESSGESKDGSTTPDVESDAGKDVEDDKESTESEESKEHKDPIEDSVEDEEVIEGVFNDLIHDGEDHEWVIAKDEYEYDESLIDKIDEQIEKFEDTINDVSKFLKLFKGRIKPREVSGFTRGKFDVRRAMQNKMQGGCDVKLFKQSVRRGQDADLAVSLLCDNSGSMTGTKSILCSRAALTLAQACEWADIPFECNAFTKERDGLGYPCYTIVEKSFEDKFEASKPFFGINDSTLLKRYLRSDRPIFTFSGNSEEVNLYYIWKKFAKVKHRSKLLIVLCDGGTTGSVADLKQIVRQIEAEDGIIVLGIGIMCRQVADIYPHHKLFNSEEELNNDLAPYLVDVISKYAI